MRSGWEQEDGGSKAAHGTQSVNRCAEMRRKTHTLVQKREGGRGGEGGEDRTQSVNRCAEMRRKTHTVVQKCAPRTVFGGAQHANRSLEMLRKT